MLFYADAKYKFKGGGGRAEAEAKVRTICCPTHCKHVLSYVNVAIKYV